MTDHEQIISRLILLETTVSNIELHVTQIQHDINNIKMQIKYLEYVLKDLNKK